MTDQETVYQRIGEFVVSFQWLENKLREIGWFIIDSQRKDWPTRDLRGLTNEKLITTVEELFMQALPQCKLDKELENEFKTSFATFTEALHQLRRDRNRILHSAFVEFKIGSEFMGLMRSNPKIQIDEDTGNVLFDQEILTPESFNAEMRKMAEVAFFLNRAFMQLIQRFPHGDVQSFASGELSLQPAPGL